MNCPECGNRLAWDDGAFCKLCMGIANGRSGRFQEAKKAANKRIERTPGSAAHPERWIFRSQNAHKTDE